MAMSEFIVCNFTAFLCFARDGPVSVEARSGSAPAWGSGMLALLPPGACETLKKMGVMVDLHDFGFDKSFGYMAYWWSHGVSSPRCTSSRFPYNFNMTELSDVPSRSAFSTRLLNADGKLTGDRIVPASPVHFELEDLTTVSTIQAQVCWCLSEYCPFEVPGS